MNTLQTLLAGVLVVLLIAVTDPFMYWMPPAAGMLALVIAAGCIALFAGLVVRERGGDERDLANRSFAGRAAYLAGILVLTVALVVKGMNHTLDLWVPLALGVMIVAKVFAHRYADRNH